MVKGYKVFKQAGNSVTVPVIYWVPRRLGSGGRGFN